MAHTISPSQPEELAQALASARASGHPITLTGAGSKSGYGGPLPPAGTIVSTASLNRILQYEPHDLTISVQAGLGWAELERTLAGHHQAIPIDPPFSQAATVGGVVATGLSGPRRLKTGSVRDLVIGMSFATLEGKLVQTGGMVVKNVAGLDMAKLMAGSWGTLAAIASVNFKLIPSPPLTRTFLLPASRLDGAQRGLLQPVAYDLRKLPRQPAQLLIQCAGTEAVIARCTRELPGAESLEGPAEAALWEEVREFGPRFLAAHPEGVIVRTPCTLTQTPRLVEELPYSGVARAGNGVVHAAFPSPDEALDWMRLCQSQGLAPVAEAAPAGFPLEQRWPAPGGDFPLMQQLKSMFDPTHILNNGRLYGRI
ncbi:MAG: FAD-binding oxidoreductase [Bryobacterales bacterium]|nr:FAD-binding oxidoreductase [Bryobacterales bacterium]